MKFSFSALLLLCIICVPTLVSGQITTAQGFIITETGEKQAGELEYVNANISAKRIFIPEGSREITVLRPNMVQSFQISPEVHFKTLSLKGKKVFFQVISEGPLNLYKYKGELFVKTPSDSLLHLTGGKKTEMKNGKKFAVVDFSYKKQLKQALNNPAFDQQLNTLMFDKKRISHLAKEINGQSEIHPEPALRNQHQFEVNFSYTRNAVTLKNIDFREDTISFGETFKEEADFDYLPGERHKVAGFGLGLFYKLKAGRKYSYFKAGLVYNLVPKAQRTQYYSFYAWRNLDHPDNWQHMNNGNSQDTYTYKLSTLEIPVSYHADLTDGRIRPFIELGLVSKLYSLASVTLKREIANSEGIVRTEYDAMELPPVMIGPMISIGYKYLLSQNHSVMAGINANASTSFEHRPTHNLHRNSNLNVFVAYGF